MLKIAIFTNHYDKQVLSLCINNINNHYFEGFKKIIQIVSPLEIINNLKKLNLKAQIINENKFLNKKDFKKKFLIKINENKILRKSNWYYQQILKIQYILKNQNCDVLIIDGDSVLLSNLKFKYSNHYSFNFFTEDEFHKDYHINLKQHFNLKKKHKYSHIVQFGYYTQHEIKKIAKYFSLLTNQKKYTNHEIINNHIIKSISNNYRTIFRFSEYELLGSLKKNNQLKKIKTLRFNYKLKQMQLNLLKFLSIDIISFEPSWENKSFKEMKNFNFLKFVNHFFLNKNE